MTTVISVENLSKSYRLGQISGRTITEDLNRWWARVRSKPDPYLKVGQTDHGNRRGEHLWALMEISFTVEQGDVLGIIGRNGAGKSTLLKILSRVTAPTSGLIKVRGRVASLLEVGTGFHPDLTGRENVFLNGAILGMKRREIGRKFDEIVAFAEIEKFIDTPVKRYSSGMYVRLAFAVAAHLDPEILVVDEVLAVGDADFQRKCLGQMEKVSHEGRTVLFVSHNMAAVGSLCTRAILVDGGRIGRDGDPAEVIEHYVDRQAHASSACEIEDTDGRGYRLLKETVERPFQCGQAVKIRYEVRCPGTVLRPTTGIILYDALDNAVFGTSSRFQKITGAADGRSWQIGCDFGMVPLNVGKYHMTVYFGDEFRDHAVFPKAIAIEVTDADPFGWGYRVPRVWGHFFWKTNWTISRAVREETP